MQLAGKQWKSTTSHGDALPLRGSKVASGERMAMFRVKSTEGQSG